MPGPLGFTGVTVDPNWAWNTLGWNSQVNTGGDVEETSSVSQPNGPTAGFLATSVPQLVTSNTNVTNPNSFAVNVIVSGGTVLTNVTVGSTTVGTGAGTYSVPGAGTIKVTYTTAPTLTTLNAAPAVPATTVAATNTSGLTAQITQTASGVTGTVVSVNGTTIAATIPQYASWFVPPGGTIALTYSAGTPTWVWQLIN
jgi:hypothetical protein